MAQKSSTGDMCLYFLAVILPPLAVFLKTGCGANFLINILLSILGWIPGVIHAWYIIGKNTTPAEIGESEKRTMRELDPRLVLCRGMLNVMGLRDGMSAATWS